MFFLFTDFGYQGPYVGQMKAILGKRHPTMPIIDLMHDAPQFNARAASYLLGVLSDRIPQNAFTVAVVDPGVGSDRRPVAVQADGRWFIGPDNGLLQMVARQAQQVSVHEITWRPEKLSASFHGRDIFAPVAAEIAAGNLDQLNALSQNDTLIGENWPEDLAEVIYCDGYGNAMLGLRYDRFQKGTRIRIADVDIPFASTFSDVAVGAPIAYKNSLGLVEIAVNQGNASQLFRLSPGSKIRLASESND